MPFNGSNTFTIVNTFVPGTTILSSAVNTNFLDIATGLSDCVTRDAQGAVTGNLVFSSTGFLMLPSGTTLQRPTGAQQAYFRFNSDFGTPEYFDGTAWDTISSTIAIARGYLTLTNLAGGGPITSADVIAATSVYYSPLLGNTCPIYNGSSFVNQIFTEQTLSLVSQHVASTIYDVFAFINNSTFTIATGPAWASSSAGSGSRGTGAGTTQLQRLNGILTNQVSITARNGGTTYTIPANQGTYLGSIFIDGTAGQISCYVSYGQNRKWGVWNQYNRQPILLKAGDSTANWSYSSTTIRQSHGSTGNTLTVFSGLQEERYDLSFIQNYNGGTTSSSVQSGGTNLIGWNSITAGSGLAGINSPQIVGTNALVTLNTGSARFLQAPSLGINNVNSLEASEANGNGVIFYGTEANMLLSAQWRG